MDTVRIKIKILGGILFIGSIFLLYHQIIFLTTNAGTILGILGTIILPPTTALLASAIGLWHLKNWARILAIIGFALSLLPILMLIELGRISSGLNFKEKVLSIIIVAIPLFLIWYLTRSHVRKMFS